MNLGFLIQNDNNKPILWQKNSHIYSRTKKRTEEIINALSDFGHKSRVFESLKDFYDLFCQNKLELDLVFYEIESCFNRNTNGFIPAFLQMNNIPFIGNDTYINTITSDKWLLKDIAQFLGLETPIAFLISDFDKIILPHHYGIKYPCVLKYRYGSMSFHTLKIENEAEFRKQVQFMLEQKNGPLLCEEYIAGHELSIPIIGTAPHEHILSILEYTDLDGNPLEMYDTLWKGENDKFVQLTPLGISHQAFQKLSDYTHKLYRYLNFHDYARFDFRLSETNVPYLLEANPLPALAIESAFDPESYGLKISFGEVLNIIVNNAVNRNKMLRGNVYNE